MVRRDQFFEMLSEVAYDLDQTHGQVLQLRLAAEMRDEELVSEDAMCMLGVLTRNVADASEQAQRLAKLLHCEPTIGRGISIVEQVRDNYRACRSYKTPNVLDLTGLPPERQRPGGEAA